MAKKNYSHTHSNPQMEAMENEESETSKKTDSSEKAPGIEERSSAPDRQTIDTDQKGFDKLKQERGGKFLKHGKIDGTALRWADDEPSRTESPGFYIMDDSENFVSFFDAYTQLRPLAESGNSTAASILARFPRNRLPADAPMSPKTSDEQAGGPEIADAGLQEKKTITAPGSPMIAKEPIPPTGTALNRRKANASPRQLSPALDRPPAR